MTIERILYRGVFTAFLFLPFGAAMGTEAGYGVRSFAERESQLSSEWAIFSLATQRNDYATAYNIIRPLAEAGDARAQYFVGSFFDMGFGVPEDIREALRWYHLAANQGYPAAQTSLGLTYYTGDRVTQDYGQARTWFLRAAAQDEADAQYFLGRIFENGEGVQKNNEAALRWYLRSANHGNAGAQYRAGALYGIGEGVERNNVQAYMWLTLSAAQGYSNAVEVRDALRQFMTPTEIAEASLLALKWRPQ
jgi:hypothetical protein